MGQAWWSAVPPILIASVLLVVPGLVVLIAGWGWRRLGVLFLAPAVSIAILAVSATLAPFIGLAWSLLPVLLLTLAAAAVAFLLRRWVGRETATVPPLRVIIAGVVGLVLAGVIIGIQLAYVFVAPGNISQTFDAIVHLNTVQFAVQTADASAFHIGATTDIPFYPNGWHSLAALTAQVGGASIPVAVNATNIAVGAVAWPASCIALAAVFFGERMAALISAAALSTGFGAFPILLFYFGVLYPNAVAYAVVPAGIAVVWLLCRSRSVADRVRSAVLLAVVSAGIGLAHPNAFLALFAFGTSVVLAEMLRVAWARRSARVWAINGAIAAVLLIVGALLWHYSRTGWDMSRWGAWQSTAQAFGEAVLITPRAFPLTITTAALVLIGLIAAVRRPSRLVYTLPFAVAMVLFILASGTSVDNPLREHVTNPWYNDSFRLAALLPVAGIPVITLGILAIVDGGAAFARRRSIPRVLVTIAAIVGALALFTVGFGRNVTATAEEARSSYVLDANSALLTRDEAALIGRLDQTTPTDAVIAGSPWTGTSLAYALAGRDVVEFHVFGNRGPEKAYLDGHLRDIDTDPLVCDAVRAIGATYVLDFGGRNVFNDPSRATDWAGIQALGSPRALQLVDSAGPDARLFRITGC